jgi:hypothetical protein
MAIYLAPPALGLGDLVVTLPVVQQLIARSDVPVFLVVRAQEHQDLARRIPGLAGSRLEWEVPGCLSSEDTFIDLRDHPLQREFWWGSKPFLDKYVGWNIEDVIGTICRDKNLPVDFNAPYQQLKFNRRKELADRILFVPGSAVSAKCWPTQKWIQLAGNMHSAGAGCGTCSAEQLSRSRLRAQRLCAVIGQPEKSDEARALVEAGLQWYETPTVADALDAVSSCKAVISVDTGIMHMAVHQGTPTVAIYRWSPVYNRARPNFRAVIAEQPCSPACYEAELNCAHHKKPAAGKDFQPLNWSCQSQHACLEGIAVETVARATLTTCTSRSSL